MNAPFRLPVIPADERQEIANSPETPDSSASVAIPVTFDLDALDQHKYQAVRQRSAFNSWRD